ncbi:MAG: phosphatase PAP2 family protein, partial [Candidatus Saccharimonadales bacterium]
MHQLVVIVAKYFIVLSALVTLAVLLKIKRPQQIRLIVAIVIGGVITYLLAKIGGHLYYDPRPFVAGHFAPYFGHANDNGFPSDHTLLAGLLAFSAWKYSRKAGYLLLALAIMIGGARVIAGVHHSADIVG